MPLQLPVISQEESYTQLALVGDGVRKIRRDLFSIWGALVVFRQVICVITFIF